MRFEWERLRKLADTLWERRAAASCGCAEILWRDGKTPRAEALCPGAPLAPWTPGACWGGADGHAWFRLRLTVPPGMAGLRAVLTTATCPDNQWDGNNSQFLAFLGGETAESLDKNHRELILSEHAVPGETFVVDLEGMYEHFFPTPVSLFCRLDGIDAETEALYYDFDVLLQSAALFEESSMERGALLRTLRHAASLLDLRVPGSPEYREGVRRARAFLAENAWNGSGNGAVVHGVGHTHIDVAWLWDLSQTREKVARSFSTMIRLMDRYPEFTFFSSQPQLYRFLKEDDPVLYEKVRARVREGRWEADGAMYLEADCNIPSGESLARQLIHGKRFFRDEFGVDSRILWLPDVFGYSAALPQLMKLAGVDAFMTTKISWNDTNRMPADSFYWEGIDGTRILTHFITTTSDYALNPWLTAYCGPLTPKHVKGAWDRYRQKDLNPSVLVAYGYGDGGGGTTPEMIETARRLEKGVPGLPRFRFSSAREFFRELSENLRDNPDAPVWVGELYLEYHRGTYTTMARNKRYNRRCEFLLLEAEQLAAQEELLLGRKDGARGLRGELWELLLLNQFHDIIPGSSIERVYRDSREQYERILREAGALCTASRQAVARAVSDGPSAAVFNPTSFACGGLTETSLPDGLFPSGEGCPLPAQRLENGNWLVRFPEIPAKGYRVFPLSAGSARENDSGLRVSERLLENRFLRVRFDEKMRICSLFDKEEERELVPEGQAYNRLLAFEDRPHDFDAWNVEEYHEEKYWELDDVEQAEITECGPLRASLRVRRRFLRSTVTQEIRLEADSRVLTFETAADWHEDHLFLKAEFPHDLHTPQAAFETQYGSVQRPTHRNTSWDEAKFEVCCHKWLDLSEYGYGVSVLNDCKYGCGVLGARVRLSLLRSPSWPNPNADREEHRFSYAVFPHRGDWREAGTVREAYRLNWPASVSLTAGGRRTVPAAFSVVSLDCPTAAVEAVKPADDGDDLVVRLYEFGGGRSRCTMRCGAPIAEAWECDLLETNGTPLAPRGHCLSFPLRPYEIKTFRLRLQRRDAESEE